MQTGFAWSPLTIGRAVRRFAMGANGAEIKKLDGRRTHGVSQTETFPSGAKLVYFKSPGPICSAAIVVATTPVSDAGHPHCLEHLVFMGSENYPKRGFLDMLATRSFSDGTNAWTSEDHTAYTISTAGAQGLLQVLPVYLDHVLRPRFNIGQFRNEVYHIRENGEEAGVVFQEMHSRENTEGDVVSYAWHRGLFKDTYLAHECGGRTKEISELQMTAVQEFHQKNYQPSNITVFLIGGDDINATEFYQAMYPALEKDETTATKRDDTSLMPEKVRFQEPAIRHVKFPSSDEEHGSITVAWHGPELKDVYSTVAVEVVLQYLTENEASPLSQRFVEIENPMASSVDYNLELFPTTVIILGFSGVPMDSADDGSLHVDDEDEDEDEDGEDEDWSDGDEDDDSDENEDEETRSLLKDSVFVDMVIKEIRSLVEGDLPGGLQGIRESVKRYRRSLLLEVENDVHTFVVDALVPDAIHSNGLEVGKRVGAELNAVNRLLMEDETFWRNTMKNWLLENSSRVTVVSTPNRSLSEELQKERSDATAERLKDLGNLPMGPENSKPSLESSLFPKLPDAAKICKIPSQVVRVDSHSQTAAVNSEFSSMYIVLESKHIPSQLREYLPLLCSLLFCIEVVSPDGTVVDYEDVVRELSEACVHHYIGVGRNSGTFRSGSVHHSIVLDVNCERGRENDALDLVFRSLFRGQFQAERLTAMLSNLYSDTTESIRDGEVVSRALMRSMMAKIRGDRESNAALVNVLWQHKVLERLNKEATEKILPRLEELRSYLIAQSTPFVHVGGLTPQPVLESVRNLWGKYTDQPCDLSLPNPYRQEPLQNLVARSISQDEWPSVLVPIAGVESAYFRLAADCPVHDEHPDFHALEVLCELLSQTEGALYNGIRGEGLAYGAALWLNSLEGVLLLTISESASPHEAWAVAVDVVRDVLRSDWTPSELELDSAKASVLYQMHGERMTPSMTVDNSFALAARGVLGGEEEFCRREKLLSDVTAEDINRVKSYLAKLLEPAGRCAVVTSGPGSANAIQEGFRTSKTPISLSIDVLDTPMDT